MVRVSVLPPFDHEYPVASIGIGDCAELSVLKMNSGSLYSETALVRYPVEASEYGLNVAVIGESGVLSTASVLPIFTLPELPLPLLELLPQAAAPRLSAPATATAARILCFIA